MFRSGVERETGKRRCRWTLGPALSNGPRGSRYSKIQSGHGLLYLARRVIPVAWMLTGNEYLAGEEDRHDLSRQFPEEPGL